MRDRTFSPALAYYVSAHGYGHGVRSCDIVRALNDLRPDVRVYLVSDMPASFFRNRLPSNSNCFRRGSFDVGMVQLDSIRVDVGATLERIEFLYSRRQELVRQEAAFQEEAAISAVVVDIPALPLEAAARRRIPGIAVGNFGWDWIYSSFIPQDRRWERIVGEIREGYVQADLLLRLPFAEDMRVFRHVEDIPVVASPGLERRTEIARLTGAKTSRPWVLISFTSLDWDSKALDNVEHCAEYEFFTVLPLGWHRSNIHAVDRDRISFTDMVASVDVVISKPGFGILSECLVNRKPLIYADRRDFPEYAVLEEAIRKYLKHEHIPAERLYSGHLREFLRNALDLPAPPLSHAVGGATIAARRLLDFL